MTTAMPAFVICRRCGDAIAREEVRGKHRRCAPCRQRSTDRWKKAHPERLKELRVQWRSKDVARTLWMSAKHRAKRLGIEFRLTVSDVIVPACCPVLGVELQFQAAGRGNYETSPTLDRVDPSRGYVAGNVAVISGRANRIKSYGTAAEHEAVAMWMRSKLA